MARPLAGAWNMFASFSPDGRRLAVGIDEDDSEARLSRVVAPLPELLKRSYAAAAARGYRWHEFGDSHLILPA